MQKKLNVFGLIAVLSTKISMTKINKTKNIQEKTEKINEIDLTRPKLPRKIQNTIWKLERTKIVKQPEKY